MAVVYHWKHGWIPLDHTAALAKAKGNHGLAATYLKDAPSAKGITSRQHVAKAALDLPNLTRAEDRSAAHQQLRGAAQEHSAMDLLPSRTHAAKNPMNELVDGTRYRETPAGIIAVRGGREVHLLGTSVVAHTKARHALASNSFDKLFKSGKKAPGMKNTAFHKFT